MSVPVPTGGSAWHYGVSVPDRLVEAPGITLCLFQTDWWKRLALRCVCSRQTGGSAWHYVVSVPDRLVEAPGTTLCKRLVLRSVRSSTDWWKRLAVRCVSAWHYVVFVPVPTGGNAWHYEVAVPVPTG